MRRVNPEAPALSNPELSACLVCYNDAPTIRELVATAGLALDLIGLTGEIIVVDDGSTDASAQELREAKLREPRLRVLRHSRNRGYGAAVRSAFAMARGEWVFYTDGDGQYDPFELILLAERIGDSVDVVQGYKRSRSDSLTRRVVGELYRLGVGAAFRLSIRDIDCDFRLIRRSLLETLELHRTSGAICVELVRKLQVEGARFEEVEVSHYERRAGDSQFFTPGKVGRALVAVAWLWISLVAAPRLRTSVIGLVSKTLHPGRLLSARQYGCYPADSEFADLNRAHHDGNRNRNLQGISELRAAVMPTSRASMPAECKQENRSDEPSR
jgi:glycosyltransferase involved in cell wall biosynthesis